MSVTIAALTDKGGMRIPSRQAPEIEGYLPGFRLDRRHTEKLIDLYDLASLQARHGLEITTELLARVHPMAKPGGRNGALGNYSQPVRRLLAFAEQAGIVIRCLTGRGHSMRLWFDDPAHVLARTSQLLDALAPSDAELDDDDENAVDEAAWAEIIQARRAA